MFNLFLLGSRLSLFLQALSAIAVSVETMFPNSAGAAKLNAAVGLATAITPEVVQMAGTVENLKTAFSGVVAAANLPGGPLDVIKNPAPVEEQSGVQAQVQAAATTSDRNTA